MFRNTEVLCGRNGVPILCWRKDSKKVRFLVHSYTEEDIKAYPVELYLSTVNESEIIYKRKSDGTQQSFCTTERYFWTFVRQGHWVGQLTILKGKLQRSLLEAIESLEKTGRLCRYDFTRYHKAEKRKVKDNLVSTQARTKPQVIKV